MVTPMSFLKSVSETVINSLKISGITLFLAPLDMLWYLPKGVAGSTMVSISYRNLRNDVAYPNFQTISLVFHHSQSILFDDIISLSSHGEPNAHSHFAIVETPSVCLNLRLYMESLICTSHNNVDICEHCCWSFRIGSFIFVWCLLSMWVNWSNFLSFTDDSYNAVQDAVCHYVIQDVCSVVLYSWFDVLNPNVVFGRDTYTNISTPVSHTSMSKYII